MKTSHSSPDLELAFDVGHGSIGWAVLQNGSQTQIKGCGVVIFRPDDCLASKRREFRRQRRHIRSTRQRIKRMKLLLAHLGVLTQEQLDKPGCAWPWKLAAQVLVGGPTLTWPELWDVLRWYAHNRGYDANRRWSTIEIDLDEEQEDTEKLKTAEGLLKKHGVRTMAEAFCKELGVDPLGSKCASKVWFKGVNAAFPREVVEAEVRSILRAHFGKLKAVDELLEKALCDDWRAIECPAIRLPKRYEGGLLFGQLIPRFNNRIISKCPITGKKVPSRNCPEFLKFRWAMLLANVKVAGTADRELRPLTVAERQAVDAKMREKGALTAEEFKHAVRTASGCSRDNLDAMLMHPDAHEALLLDPVQRELSRDELIAALFAKLPVRIQKRARGQLRRGKTITLGQLRDQAIALGESVEAFDNELNRLLEAATIRRRRKKDAALTAESVLKRSLYVEKLTGRAPYSREILVKAYEEVMAGKHPAEEGGCLFVTDQMREAQLQREIDEQTNNHLVRHRLKILDRLLRDIITEYAGNDKTRIAKITIEVNRDLREMSGKTAKEKAQYFRLLTADHHRVAEKLKKALAGQTVDGKPIRISASRIRKARVAEDLNWTCPYTGQKYEPIDLVTERVDEDHIVPRSQRMSDSLESLVISFSAVNKWKGKRTAMRFIKEEQGKPVPGLPNLSIVSLNRYLEFVDSLPPRNDPRKLKRHLKLLQPIDDDLRKWRRKELLKLEEYEQEEFTPRDLTQTSQLARMAAQMVKRTFQDVEQKPVIVSMPGSVTSTVRKGWDLLGCLSKACPEVLDETGQVKTKSEIRDITHLHHALDACVLGLAAHFIPNNGDIWKLIIKQDLNETEKDLLRPLGIFDIGEKRFRLKDLPNELKNQLRERLAELRVVQHIPKRMTGMRVDQTVWRVFDPQDQHPSARRLARWFKKAGVNVPAPDADTVLIVCRKRRSQPDSETGKTLHETKTWRWVYQEIAKSKLIGLQPRPGSEGRLKKLKAVKILADNYGVALDPEPQIIRFHKVWPQLNELRQKNGSKPVRVLRNGQLIRVPRGTYAGIWRIVSTKSTEAFGLALDLALPDRVKLTRGNVPIKRLIEDGLEVVDCPYTGVDASKIEFAPVKKRPRKSKTAPAETTTPPSSSA